MNIKILTVFIITCTIIFSQSPYTNIQISNQNSPNELSIQINPKNINQLVAGANIHWYYYSSNGGTTWTRGQLTSSSWGVWGDPCIIVDTNQNFYFFHLSNSVSPGYWIDRIVCQKSTNAGVSWNDPGSYTHFLSPKEQDKEWAICDFTHGPRGNWLYCTWTQFDNYGSSNSADSSNILFARSTDGGNSWTGVTRINKLAGNCIDEDYTVEGAVPAVGPNGEVYVAWAGPQGVNNLKIFFDKSTDGGNTWLANDIVAANNPGGWDLGPPSTIGVSGIYRANGMPVTCCDLSNGPYRGYIYINYLDSVGTRDRDVMFIRSTNGGTSWSTPIRVNNDPPGKEQFFTWMTIDRATGVIYIVFYDRRNYSDNQTDVYLAYSTNAGTTWVNERISSSPFTPSQSQFFGDYIGITAHNGRVRPHWMRRESGGSLANYTAIIDFPLGLKNVNNEIPGSFALYQNYPNPFNPVTKIKFSLPLPSKGGVYDVKLTVYDIVGREIALIVNQELSPGTYEYEWDASALASGVYFYTLKAGGFESTKKLILNK